MSKWLSDRLARPELLIAPGAYDAFTAKLVSCSGSEVVYCGGFATTASGYGLPDVGLLGMAETTGMYRRIAAVVETPLIVDGDTGYGGPLNAARTVQELGRIGVAGVHIEDQQDPKRCGHVDGKRVLSPDDAAARVRAAADASAGGGPAIIARTDALAPEGMASVVDRLGRYAEAGADAIFVDAVRNLDELREVRAATTLPLVFNAARTGVGPTLTAAELSEVGVDMVLYPIELMMAAMDASRRMLGELLAGNAPDVPVSFADLNDLLELPEYVARDRKYRG